MIVLASSNVPSWAVLLIVIGIFVVIGGVAFLIYFLLKRKAPKEEKVVESKKEPVIEDVFKNIEPYEEEVIKSDSTQNIPQYNSEIAIKNIPSGLKEEDAKRLEQHLLEMNPSLSRSQAFFYARHCTLGMSYTISQFKKEVGCAYETARTSMDNLVNLGYYRKEMLRNKFIYTPVKKY